MTRSTSGNLGASSKPALKSPLRVATMPLLREAPDATPDPVREAARAPQEITARQLRQMQISEFKAWLRTQTNKHRRPYQEETISDYAETASALDRLFLA